MERTFREVELQWKGSPRVKDEQDERHSYLGPRGGASGWRLGLGIGRGIIRETKDACSERREDMYE